MCAVLPIVCFARHRETTPSLPQTGLTDLPFTKCGELSAHGLDRRLDSARCVSGNVLLFS
jgi:hypothetical protein